MDSAIIWHDVECGRYERDLTLWLEFAQEHGSPVLDVGAGTGRVALALARVGHQVVALDSDRVLLEELARRALGLDLTTVEADARSFEIADQTFPLIIAPMQTIQLLGGGDGHRAFLNAARAHLRPGGVLAIAIAPATEFEEFRWSDGDPFPMPDMTEMDGCVYSSQPTAVHREGSSFILERRRDVVDPGGARSSSTDRIALDIVSSEDIVSAGAEAGLREVDTVLIPPTLEHIGSEVVILGV